HRAALFHRRHHGDRGADRREDLFLDRHHVGRLDRVQDADAVGGGLHLPVHPRRRHRRGAGQCRRRPRAAGHLLCRRPLPLRAVARRRVRHLRRLVLLVPEDDRLHVFRVRRQAALLADLHRRQHRVLPAALPGARRDAAPHRRLSGCLRRLEFHLLDRLVLFRLRRAGVLLRHHPGLHPQGARRRQSLGAGRHHAGMDAAVAAAVPPIRHAAADQMSVTLARIEPSIAGVGDYIELMKPRVMSLLVFTAFVGVSIAPGHVRPVIAATALLCIAVGSVPAGALNMWYDADIDARMARTAGRPIPQGRVTPGEAAGFGLTLAAFAIVTLGLLVNWVAASLLAFTIAFYVVVYTMWLKRSTPQNIVIGGAAGALPPIIGWAAVTG